MNINEWLAENSFSSTTLNGCIPDLPFLNCINGYPEELHYTDLRQLPHKWFRVYALMRKEEKSFTSTKVLLIYVWLGSMGSIDVKLMKRLVEVLLNFCINL